MSCNICNEQYHSMIINGQAEMITVKEKSENCLVCQRAPRFKTMKTAYDQYVVPSLRRPGQQLSALVVSGTKWEQETISRDFATVVSSSLYGEYGARTIKSDLRDLKQFSDDQFNYVHACNVLDYIFEIDEVLSSVFRVLKSDGIFLCHLAQERLTGNAVPPQIVGGKTEPYYPNGLKLPSVRFGKRDFINRMNKKGFQSDLYEIPDIFSGQICTWFRGTKM